MKNTPAETRIDDKSKDRLRLWLRLLKTTREIESHLRENFRSQFDTTLPRFDVMAALSRFEGGLKMSEISSLLKVSNGNVTGIVDRLVNDGHLVRETVPGDRRAYSVRMTKKGREDFDRQANAHEAWIAALLEHVSAEDARAITANLSLSHDEMEKADAP